jgi:TolB-like protein
LSACSNVFTRTFACQKTEPASNCPFGVEGVMAHDVFISYSSKDKQTADKICSTLEARGIHCWMAPRDITPGSDWSESVIDAIEKSKAFVMVFSANANESDQIRREVQNAANNHIPLIPLRVENVTPSKSLQYFLATQHWLDAFPPPLEDHLQYLAKVIRNLMDGKPAPEHVPARKRIDRRLLVSAGVAVTATVAGAGLWSGRRFFSSIGSLGGTGGVSVTVLPLKNLSDNRQQEFFSDGQTDAIAAALTNIKGLTVVGQNSVYALKTQTEDPSAIGRALKADYLIQGSVRWSDKQVNVTANLVKVGDNAYLWAHSYNRELNNVLNTQEEIAQDIAASVRMPLGLAGGPPKAIASNGPSEQPHPVNNQTALDYLRAKALLRSRSSREPGGPLTRAAGLLEGVVGREPDFAPAWALLAEVYGFISTYHALYFSGTGAELKAVFDAWIPKAENAAQTAITLSPASAAANISMGLVRNFRCKFSLAEDSYKKALQLEPNNTDALHLYSLMLLCVGRVKEGALLRQRLHALEPFVLVYNAFNVDAFWLSGNDRAALNILQTVLAPGASNPFMARQTALIYGAQGKHQEAAAAIRKASRNYDPDIVAAAAKFMAGDWSAAPDRPSLGLFDMLQVFSPSPDRALGFFETNLKAGMWSATEAPQFWHPSQKFAALRNTRRFKDLMRSAGVVDYWRGRGWPDDLCRPASGGNFACD